MTSALSIANPAPSERHLTGGILFLLAGLAALGALATNIILPAFPRIGADLTTASVLALLVFIQVFLRRPRAEPIGPTGTPKSTGG